MSDDYWNPLEGACFAFWSMQKHVCEFIFFIRFSKTSHRTDLFILSHMPFIMLALAEIVNIIFHIFLNVSWVYRKQLYCMLPMYSSLIMRFRNTYLLMSHLTIKQCCRYTHTVKMCPLLRLAVNINMILQNHMFNLSNIRMLWKFFE